VLLYERPGERFRVEVHELKGRRWQLLRGPFWFAELERALTHHLRVAESLRGRVNMEKR
jgi:hypothetical protein